MMDVEDGERGSPLKLKTKDKGPDPVNLPIRHHLNRLAGWTTMVRLSLDEAF